MPEDEIEKLERDMGRQGTEAPNIRHTKKRGSKKTLSGDNAKIKGAKITGKTRESRLRVSTSSQKKSPWGERLVH